MPPEPYFDLYTRNGFVGPASTLIRTQHSPDYTRVEGIYAPRRIDTGRLDVGLFSPRPLPIPLLDSGDVKVSSWRLRQSTPFAIRNVVGDELLFVVSGTARLETDFGVLDLVPEDFVLLPRAVTYRLVEVDQFDALVVSADDATTWRIDPEHAAVLNPDLHVDTPRPYDDPVAGEGEYEVLVLHGDGCTSFFYDRDPIPIAATGGAPVVQRFNLTNVQGISVEQGSVPPPRLINDSSTRNLFFYLGSRKVDDPPIHHNADYDEVVVYTRGPGHYGSLDTPGFVTWTPKGIVHEGPPENVVAGYRAWLFESRARLRPTTAALKISEVMETTNWEVHPSVAGSRR
ncbi:MULTISPECIES: homogentisate 1,2-dioxygenase [unclassified Mycobacterium]|uniref:homogentisate 1,2-dioxygenase n=1 Tax=unclassified Mycobacterium TaxID=2642494 RepID=UPI0029C73F63|nr:MULTISPECIES: homogentisate 1,2-dioxygenase [unclassified Mycobacterium]